MHEFKESQKYLQASLNGLRDANYEREFEQAQQRISKLWEMQTASLNWDYFAVGKRGKWINSFKLILKLSESKHHLLFDRLFVEPCASVLLWAPVALSEQLHLAQVTACVQTARPYYWRLDWVARRPRRLRLELAWACVRGVAKSVFIQWLLEVCWGAHGSVDCCCANTYCAVVVAPHDWVVSLTHLRCCCFEHRFRFSNYRAERRF